MFTKYVTKEYGARGISANIVAPGAIETDFNNALRIEASGGMFL